MISEQRGDVDGLPAYWRRADGPCAATIYLHDFPSLAEQWDPFLSELGGIAPDLPGFGRAGKPGHFSYDFDGYAEWLPEFLDLAGAPRELDLVMHGWGAAGLVWAMRNPERVRRIVLLDALPLLPEFEWEGWARWWRRRGAGELVMGALTRRTFARAFPLPAELDALVWEHFDEGTQRALLRLHRFANSEELERWNSALEDITARTLVAWGASDGTFDGRFAGSYGARLANAEVELLSDAGHWPWLDRPDLVERVGAFLRAGG